MTEAPDRMSHASGEGIDVARPAASFAAPPAAAAIVVAAGAGRRFNDGGGPRKQYRELLGKPVLAWALDAFVSHPGIGQTVVVLPREDVDDPPGWLAGLPVARVAGGAERSDSVRNGLDAVTAEGGVVLVHDGARPLVARALIDRLLAAAAHGAVIPGLKVTDTLKEVDAEGLVKATPDRGRYRSVQTPQAFPLALLRKVHRQAHEMGAKATDDAALLERYGHAVRVVEGDPSNLKVTTSADLALAELLARRLPDPGARA